MQTKLLRSDGWLRPVLLSLGRLRQEEHWDLEANWCHIVAMSDEIRAAALRDN